MNVVEFNRVSKYFTLKHAQSRSLQQTIVDFFRRRESAWEESFWVLKDVSFTVKDGETVGFVGANGVGKSTVLKLIARIIEPTSGTLNVRGRAGGLLEVGAGFHPDLSGRENVYLNASILGLTRSEVNAKFDEIVGFSELESFIDVPVKHYSSGMYVRLAFSVAVHTRPDVLLIDEVLAVGDQNFQRKCMDKIYDMSKLGTTILLVSHNLESVARLCRRAIWLEDGRIMADGPSRDVIEGYLVEINEKDRERLATKRQKEEVTEAEEKPPEPEMRSGSGEVRIVEVAFLNGEGEARDVFLAGEPMTVRLFYKATRPVDNPVFGIGVFRDDNLHVAGPNTSMFDYAIPRLEGAGVLDFVIPRLSLAAGHYELTVSAYDATISHKFDYWHRAFSFTVQPRSPWDELGVAQLPGHWELRAGEDR